MKVEITWCGRNKSISYKLKGDNINSVLNELNAKDEWGRYDGEIKYKYYERSSLIIYVDLSGKNGQPDHYGPILVDQLNALVF